MKVDLERVIDGMVGLVYSRTALATLLVWVVAGAMWWQALA